jgi:SEC-C motif-containing protein
MSEMTPNTPCPCNSNKDYAACCGQYIGSKEHAPNPEAMMRSRYTAYVLGDIDHLVKTIPLLQRKAFDQRAALAWSKCAQWQGLEVLGTKEFEQGKKARVEFIAKYKIEDEDHVHHEIALFEKTQDRWFFVDSKILGE